MSAAIGGKTFWDIRKLETAITNVRIKGSYCLDDDPMIELLQLALEAKYHEEGIGSPPVQDQPVPIDGKTMWLEQQFKILADEVSRHRTDINSILGTLVYHKLAKESD